MSWLTATTTAPNWLMLIFFMFNGAMFLASIIHAGIADRRKAEAQLLVDLCEGYLADINEASACNDNQKVA
jgi:hypothetical protein